MILKDNIIVPLFIHNCTIEIYNLLKISRFFKIFPIISSAKNVGQIRYGKFRFVDGFAEEVIERRGKWAKRVEKRANSEVQRLFYVIFPLWLHGYVLQAGGGSVAFPWLN